MATIPIQIASRRLDTGSVVQFPQGGQIGSALESVGNELQAVAARFEAKQEQQDRFDAGVLDDELRQRLAQTEDEAARGAPADGSGIHDSVYGQLDPETSQPVKPGAFDTLFDEYAQKVPESQRARFMQTKESLRLAGSNRLATVQNSSRQAYEQVQLTKSQDTLLNGILQSDPNDTKTFEAFKQNGLDRIAASGMSALEKEKAAYNWEQNATKGLFQSQLEKDPAFAGKARAALGLAPPDAPVATGGGAIDTVVNKIIGVESGGNASAKNPKSSAAGLGQFIDSTWLATIRRHRPDIAAGKSAAQIIALKTNGPLAREMTAALTSDNAEYLTNRGVATTPGNLYLAHFLGSAGAVQVLKANPSASIGSVVGQDVVRANNFLAGKSVADTIAWSNKKMGGSSTSVPVDPRFASLAPEERLRLANQADVQYRQQQATEIAATKADYTAYKDRFELGIVQGQIADPALITNDPKLNDGDKASLLRSWKTESKGALQIQSDLTALGDGSLKLDPYGSDDKKRADNLYTDAMKRVPEEQQASIGTEIINQTGVVPQPIINNMRQGLSSRNPAQVIAAAQLAQQISAVDSAALSRRDGGSEVQKAADDFSFYVNKLNLPVEEAARRMIDKASPEKQLQRKAIEPAAKEFVKEVEKVSLANEFQEWFSGEPDLGFSPAQELGIKAEFVAIAEDQFFAANGDPEIAKNRAVEEMKRLYGVTELTGRKVITKHPPEKYWPKLRVQQVGPTSIVGDTPSLDYARIQLRDDLTAMDPAIDMGSVQLVTTPETDAMVKRGEMPGYAVLYKDANGTLQTIPGKLWRPDTAVDVERQGEVERAEQDEIVESARQEQERIRTQNKEFADEDAAAEQARKDTVGDARMKAQAAEAARENFRTQKAQERAATPTPDTPAAQDGFGFDNLGVP